MDKRQEFFCSKAYTTFLNSVSELCGNFKFVFEREAVNQRRRRTGPFQHSYGLHGQNRFFFFPTVCLKMKSYRDIILFGITYMTVERTPGLRV